MPCSNGIGSPFCLVKRKRHAFESEIFLSWISAIVVEAGEGGDLTREVGEIVRRCLAPCFGSPCLHFQLSAVSVQSDSDQTQRRKNMNLGKKKKE